MIRRLLLLTIFVLMTVPLSVAAQGDGETILLRSRGYGWIVAANDIGVVLLQETANSLLILNLGFVDEDVLYLADLDDDLSFIPFATVRVEEDTVVFDLRDGRSIVFDPIAELPQRLISEPTDDPEANFQVFWEVVEKNSSYLSLTGIDWQAAYEEYRPQVTADTTEEELFDVLGAMAAPLNDGHLHIFADSLGRRFDGRLPSPSVWMVERFGETTQVIASYLDRGEVRAAGNGLLLYGTIAETIGYLAILSFKGYSETPEDPITEEASFETALDQILSELADLDALIIDLRINDGGQDLLTRALAGRFTDRVRLAWSRQARIGAYDEFSEPTDFYFGPRGAQFLDRPVILLTSNNTVSAAEHQVMALRGLSNVRVVGETTAGAFSNTHPAILPNGWFFVLSNERVLSPENPPRDYELIGIAPDVLVAGSEEALDQDRDNILEAAIAELRGDEPCQAGPTRLCLQDDRIAVEVTWEDFDGNSGSGQAVPLTADTGSFWFFDASNLELFIKVLDGRGINDHFWVFYGALSNVEFNLTVTDILTDRAKTYHNPAGRFASVGDVEALPD